MAEHRQNKLHAAAPHHEEYGAQDCVKPISPVNGCPAEGDRRETSALCRILRSKTTDPARVCKRRLLSASAAILLAACFQCVTAFAWFNMNVTVSKNRISSGSYEMTGGIYLEKPEMSGERSSGESLSGGSTPAALCISNPSDPYGAHFWREDFIVPQNVFYLLINARPGLLDYSYAAALTAKSLPTPPGEPEGEGEPAGEGEAPESPTEAPAQSLAEEPQPLSLTIRRITPSGEQDVPSVSNTHLKSGESDLYKITIALQTPKQSAALSLHLFTGFKGTGLLLAGSREELADRAREAVEGQKICLTADMIPPSPDGAKTPEKFTLQMGFPVNLDLGGHSLAAGFSFPVDQYAAMEISNGTLLPEGGGETAEYSAWKKKVFIRYRR